MGNSPYPYGQSDYYEDFAVCNLVFEEYDNDLGYYPCTFDVNNTGDKYIEIESISISATNGSNHYIETNIDYYYYDDCIGPNQTLNIKGYSRSNQLDINDLRWSAFAYEMYAKATYTSISYVSKDSYTEQYGSSPRTRYTYRFKLEGLCIDREYYYSPLIEYKVDGVTKWKMDRSQISDDIAITSYEEYDETKLSIENIYLVKGIERRSREIANTWIAVWVIIIIVFAILLFISPLAIPIVFVCINSRKKKENKANN